MSQQNVLKLLKKTRRWMIEKEISKILKISNANTSLKKLYEQGDIFRREIKTLSGNQTCYEYKTK